MSNIELQNARVAASDIRIFVMLVASMRTCQRTGNVIDAASLERQVDAAMLLIAEAE